MDRIRMALDLARQERNRTVDQEDAVSETAFEPRATYTEVPPLPVAPSAIVYTKTQVFTPDARLLEAKRVVSDLDQPTASAAFRMLRTQVMQRMEENKWS